MNGRYRQVDSMSTGTLHHGESGSEALRQTGLEAVGAVPWGTHFCQFYATGQDLVETLVPYFRKGLAANEFCMWVTAAPLGADEAKAALGAAMPDLDDFLARGQIEILDYSQWYTQTGAFDADVVLHGWAGKLAEARQRGFDGMRVTGNTFWLEEEIWKDFRLYEDKIHGAIEGLPVLVLCAYSLEKCGLREILDVAANHEFALVKHAGRWERIRSVEHQVELALRQSRERLERFAEITFEGIVISENGRIVDCNEQFSRLMGYTVQELKGMPIGELIAPEERDRIVETILLGRDSQVEHAMIRKDGSLIFVDARGKNSPSNPTQRYTAVRDVTDHVRAKASLKESNDRLSALIEALPDAIFLKDGESRWQVVNQVAARLFQVQAFPWQGKSERELAAARPGYRSAHEACLASDEAAWAAGGLSLNIEHVQGPDGKVQELEVRKVPLFEADGRRKGLVVVGRDVTEGKRVAEALSESRKDLNRAQAVGHIGSWRMDVQHNILLWSDENYRIFGLPKGTPLTYETFLATVHPEDRDYVDRMWQAALRGEPYDIEHRLLVDGRVKWVHEKAELDLDSQGRLLGGFGTTQDVTDRKLAEQALQEADRRKDEFLAMLAHELRNPLAPIRNAAHVLGRLGLEEPRVQWAQATIEGQVAHLTRLVDDLLDVSRIVRGKITLKKEEVEFVDLAERALAAAGPLVEGKGHRLIVHLPESPVRLDVDPVRVTQVLLNLLDNAAKYNPDGGKIEFDARVEGDEIEIQVRDNGMGITAELLPHVFEMFQQGERTLDRSQGGLGIGLTLVQRLVEMHGGRVEARSDGPGQGSTFTVRLPVKVAPSSSFADNTQAEDRFVPGIRVLVVDDDPAVADSTAVLLEMEGYEVRIASSGFDALEQVPAFRPQAVLLDIGLEGMDGFETAKRLRQLPEGRGLCLMAVTGYGDEETKTSALEAGCDHHLVKPVNIDRLIGLLTEVAWASAP